MWTRTQAAVVIAAVTAFSIAQYPCAARETTTTQTSEQADSIWHFKSDLMPILAKQIPGILKDQETTSGRFGKGIWIVTDQNVLFPLATAWATQHPDNHYYHDSKLLEAIMSGGDALIADQDKKGMWTFRKKDGSTWGQIFMPWTYSRWVRAFLLIKDAMPPERREKWEKALTLGYEGIARDELSSIHNIPAHHAMGLYAAGLAFNRKEWCEQASDFMQKVVAHQHQDGYWSENVGPVVGYNFVYVDAIAVYYALSKDSRVLPALEKAARFHANFTYPNGTSVETVDERQVYHSSVPMPNVGFTMSPVGRAYIQRQWEIVKGRTTPVSADGAASYILFGEEGPAEKIPGLDESRHYVTNDGLAMVHGEGPWFTCLSAYHCPVPDRRWIQDRQNLVSLFNKDTGLIFGGGNTKLQPLWSTFTVGDKELLKHTPGDEDPVFTPPAGICHVPEVASLEPDQVLLKARMCGSNFSVKVDCSNPDGAKVTYVLNGNSTGPAEAHIPFMPKMGTAWETASGKRGILGDESISIQPGEAGDWFQHGGWKVTVPANASLTWPALPHNPYVKDGKAKPSEGRIVMILPLSEKSDIQTVTITTTGEKTAEQVTE